MTPPMTATRILYPRFGERTWTLRGFPSMISTSVPPLLPFADRVDLDYTPLLLFDQALLDVNTVSNVESLDDSSFRPLRDTLRALLDAQLIVPIDMESQLCECAADLQALDNEELAGATWTHLAKDAAAQWSRLGAQLHIALKGQLTAADMLPVGVVEWLVDTGQPLTPEATAAALRLLARYKPTTRHLLASEVQRYVTRSYLRHLHAVLFLAERLQSAWYDWSNMKTFYDAKYRRVLRTLAPEQRRLSSAYAILEQAFVAFRPTKASDIVRILRDPRLLSLRQRVKEAADAGETLDPAFAERALAALSRAKTKIQQRLWLSGWIATLVGWQSPVGSVLSKISEEALSRLLPRQQLKVHRWLYFTGLLE